ncbi:MAG: hypothetical protein LBO78_03085 [Rickettsiales bacterium]|nr:hypothetical protein [Rickettsiales bacterium]
MPDWDLQQRGVYQLHAMSGGKILSVRSIRAAYLSGGICARFQQVDMYYVRKGNVRRGGHGQLHGLSGWNVSAEYNGGQLHYVPGG